MPRRPGATTAAAGREGPRRTSAGGRRRASRLAIWGLLRALRGGIEARRGQAEGEARAEGEGKMGETMRSDGSSMNSTDTRRRTLLALALSCSSGSMDRPAVAATPRLRPLFHRVSSCCKTGDTSQNLATTARRVLLLLTPPFNFASQSAPALRPPVKRAPGLSFPLARTVRPAPAVDLAGASPPYSHLGRTRLHHSRS